MSAEKQSRVKYVHYVIVVHGIGEQRPNETVLSVINRFAEARSKDYRDKKTGTDTPFGEKGSFVSMGKVAAQVGTFPKENGRYRFSGVHPWAQFEQIPSIKGSETGTFNAVQSNDAENIRFVDMYWADILNDYMAVSGEDVTTWTDGVIGRLKNDGEYDLDKTWVLKILEQVQETALFAQKVAGLPGVNKRAAIDEIMTKFVGDIQIYGENRSVRGRAVRRFHNMMEKIHRYHCQQHDIREFDARDQMTDRYEGETDTIYIPRYTIIAHSLGTVMAMDAIMYAHINKQVAYEKEGSSRYLNLPFEEYRPSDLVWDETDEQGNTMHIPRTQGDYIGSNWIENLCNFVTLGSPVDKYLTLWPENYQYLHGCLYPDAMGDGVSEIFSDRKGFPKVRHFNYCDEQDPVGHHLDEFAATPAYQMIFERDADRDVTYNAYRVPGIAHVMYWEDQKLFSRILHQTIDSENQDQTGTGEEFAKKQSEGSYWWVIFYSYFLPAIITGLVIGGVFYWGWEHMSAEDGPNWQMGLLASFVFCLSAYFFRKLISMTIWWRQILRAKTKRPATSDARDRLQTMMKAATSKQEVKKAGKERRYREEHRSNLFRTILIAVNFILILSSIAIIPFTIARSTISGWCFAWLYVGFIALSGGGVYLLGKTSWVRSWSVKSRESTRPALYTSLTALGIGIAVVIVYQLIGENQVKTMLFDDLERKWDAVLPAISSILAALSISWMYMTVSFWSIKKELLEW